MPAASRPTRFLRRLTVLLRELVTTHRHRRQHQKKKSSKNAAKMRPQSLDASLHLTDNTLTDSIGDLLVISPDKTRTQLSYVRTLRAQNIDQPISQLPNELLCQIFVKGVLPRHAATYPALLRKFCDTKRHLGQVCHRWREIALECPDMWCNAVDLSAGNWWIREVLKRSRNRPLSVFMPQGTKEENFALVVQTHRIRGFFANVQQSHLAKQVLDHMRDLHGLEELELVAYNHSRSRWKESLDGLSRDLSIPGLLSSLRSLYLTGPSIPLPTHLMPTLTSLYVAHSWGSKTSSEWLFALRNFPNLEELSLINCIKRDKFAFPSSSAGDDHPHPSSSLTRLPQLRELELNGSHFSCGTVFRGLAIPPTCVLRMATYDAAVGLTLDAMVEFLKAGSPRYNTLSPSFHNRSLSFKATSTQLYLRVSEEGVVKLDIHLKFDDSYYDELDVAAFTVRELLSATVRRFQPQGGFSSLTISLAKLLAASRRFSYWLRLIRSSLALPQEIHTLRLQEATTVCEFLKLTEMETDSCCTGKGIVLDNKDKSAIPLRYPQLQRITLTHVDFDKQGDPVILRHIASFILRHPKIKVVHLIQCKHVDVVKEKIRNLGVEVTVD